MAVLVAIEGPDTSGKDTLQLALADKLISRRYRVRCFRTPGAMPGDRSLAGDARDLLRSGALSGRAGFVTKRSLMAADAALFCEHCLGPAMDDPGVDVVLLNRYWVSDEVYAGAEARARRRQGWEAPPVPNLSRGVYREAGAEYPDLVIRMAPGFDVCWRRLQEKDKDGAEAGYDRRFFEDVYALYEAADYRPSRVCVLRDAEALSVATVLAAIQEGLGTVARR